MIDDVKTAKPANDDRLTTLKERVFDLALETALIGEVQSLDSAPFLKSVCRDYYRINDDGEFEATDACPLDLETMRPLPVERISESLKVQHPYLFRQQSDKPASTAATPKPALQKSRAEMDASERAAFIQKWGSEKYFEIPDDPVAALPVTEKRRSQMCVEERVSIIRSRGQDYYLSLPA